MDRKAKERAKRDAGIAPPRHYRRGGYGSTLLCSTKPRSPFTRHRRQAWATSDWEEVTCKKCLNKRAELEKA
jgi:hypothetical protein